MMIYVLDKEEKIAGKGENAGNQPDVFKSLPVQDCHKSGLCGEELTLYQTTNFGWTQFKGFEDEKLNFDKIMISDFDRDRKHCGKRRKCWILAFFPFP